MHFEFATILIQNATKSNANLAIAKMDLAKTKKPAVGGLRSTY
jgi:hypothetical protein